MTANQEKIANRAVEYIINVLAVQGVTFPYAELHRGYIAGEGKNKMTEEGFKIAYDSVIETIKEGRNT